MPIIPGYMSIPCVDEEIRNFSRSIDGIYTIKICYMPPCKDQIEYFGTPKQIALQMFDKYGKPYNRFDYYQNKNGIVFDLNNELNKEFERMEKLKAFY